MKNNKQHGGHGSPDRDECEGAGEGQRSYRIGEVVEIRGLDKDDNRRRDTDTLRRTRGDTVADRPRPDAEGSLSMREDRPMIASGNDFADLVNALKNHTAAIGKLVASLAPEVPEFVGTDYIASRLGVSTTWVCRLADNGDIPKACMAPRLSGGRIRRFFRDKVDQWLSEKGHG